MNTSPILLRTLIREELQALRLADIAVVTAVFPHEEGDTNNCECNVRLRESGLELHKVPVAVPHIGMVSAPEEGDLVLLSYVHGDPNRAVVVGRLYSDKKNPPVHALHEWRVGSPLQGKTSLAIDKEESLVLTAGKTQVTIRQDGNIEISGEADLQIEVKGNAELKCTDCSVEATGNTEIKCVDCAVDASGNIDLGLGGTGVITQGTHKCYFTGQPLIPSQTVKAKG
jgi:hypothetical protein